MLINLTNHPSAGWSPEQLEAAQEQFGGDVIDFPFPAVDPRDEFFIIDAKAINIAKEVDEKYGGGHAVLCQGEFGLTFKLVTELKRRGFLVVHATSERRPLQIGPDGKPISGFNFVQFRYY